MSLHRVKQVFRQGAHCCADADTVDPTLEMELFDGGGGEYLVLRAGEWAIGDEKELGELIAEVKAMMKTAKGGLP